MTVSLGETKSPRAAVLPGCHQYVWAEGSLALAKGLSAPKGNRGQADDQRPWPPAQDPVYKGQEPWTHRAERSNIKPPELGLLQRRSVRSGLSSGVCLREAQELTVEEHL
jgi:hypothetical protein